MTSVSETGCTLVELPKNAWETKTFLVYITHLVNGKQIEYG